MEKVITADRVSFNYGNEPILDKIGFDVFKGDFVALIGSNGTGKSTLLKILLGELTPSDGSITLLGENIRQFKSWSKIGYVSQHGSSFGSSFPATAEEIVKANLFAQIGLMRFPAKHHLEKTRQALAQVGMSNYGKRLIGNLSGGQQQRVMIARVLVNDPQILLLDEPTTGIDAKSSESLYHLLHRLNRENGLTIIMVTHDVVRSLPHVGRIFCLEAGSLLELDHAQIKTELSHKHKHPLGMTESTVKKEEK